MLLEVALEMLLGVAFEVAVLLAKAMPKINKLASIFFMGFLSCNLEGGVSRGLALRL
jgi:hypothetical protein